MASCVCLKNQVTKMWYRVMVPVEVEGATAHSNPLNNELIPQS